MKVTGLVVDGFGVWSQLELPELSGEVTAFYGPNEAGKTTLMQFVRSMLYGFSAERRARYLPPVRGGRSGGSLLAVAGQKHYTISRHADEPGEAGESALVTDGVQTTHDEHSLAPLLGAVDESIFNNVFAFGLREIQELGTLSDTQAADELYNLALGLDRVSLVDVLGELEASRNRLLAKDDRPSLVTQLLGSRERLQGEIAELSQGTTRYLTLNAERDALGVEISRLEGEVARLDGQLRDLSLARVLGDRWIRRAAIDRQLATLGGFDGLPDAALARLDAIQNRLASRRKRFLKLAARRQAIHEAIERLKINEPLRRLAPRLEALGEQQQWLAALEREVSELEAELLQLESERQENAQAMGIAPLLAGAAGGLSKRAIAELRATGQNLREASRELAERKLKIQGLTEGSSARQRELATALGGNAPDLTHALAEAGELVSQLRKRVQLDQRLDQMSRRETELDEQSQEHLEQQVLPAWILVCVGGLFVLGCALVLLFLLGQILPESLSRSLSWPVGLVGVIAAVGAGLTKVWLERSAGAKLDGCQSQMGLLAQQIAQAKAERDELDEKLPRGGGPLVTRLQTAEKALAKLEDLMPIESQRDASQRELDALRSQAQSLGVRYAELKKQWRKSLAAYGLPADLKPRQVRAYAERRAALAGLAASIEAKQTALARRRGELAGVAGRITQLAAEVGLPGKGRPIEQLQTCLAEWAQQQTRLKDREQLLEENSQLVRRQKRLKRQAAVLRERRRLLLTTAGARDEAEFRRLALAQAESIKLRGEREQLVHEISVTLAGQLSEEQLADWLAAPDQLDRLETHVSDARRIAAGHLSQAVERRGEMNQQLKTLVEDRRLANKRIELGIVEKRLQDALDRWRVVTTTGLMLDAVRKYYEREHQPPALREASGYLVRLTGGRYTRVWTPLGEHRLLVDDREGRSLPIDVLSSGTREQLFLALRLALINSYARRGVRLPLVLDDVLVNFDAGRAKAAALVLRDFAREGHQVLLFTCHEHIARLFKHVKAEVRLLPDNGSAGTGEPLARKSRRARPIETEPLELEPEELEPEEIEEETPRAPEAPPPPPVEELEPEIVVPPPPAPAATRNLPRPRARVEAKPEPRIERRVHRVEWSAEEFEGELADRVRRPVRKDRETPGATTRDEDEESEAA